MHDIFEHRKFVFIHLIHFAIQLRGELKFIGIVTCVFFLTTTDVFLIPQGSLTRKEDLMNLTVLFIASGFYSCFIDQKRKSAVLTVITKSASKITERILLEAAHSIYFKHIVILSETNAKIMQRVTIVYLC